MTEALIECQTIEGASPGPHLLITAGVHGDEGEPIVALRKLARSVASRHLAGKLTIAPVVNRPAFECQARCGPDGKDLARTCPGRADGSITERIAHELYGLIRAADCYIDLHTGGAAYRISPFAGYMLHSTPAVLDQQRRMALAFGLPLCWGTCATLDGRSLSVARDENVPAIYAELAGGGGFDPGAVARCVEGCQSVMAELDMLAETGSMRSEKTYRSITIEDDSPESGHLQRNHPAPCEGWFTPCVDIGEDVLAGQPIGDVYECPDGEAHRVVAHHTGRVIVLRSLAWVVAGEGLVTIVNIPNEQERDHV